jgi:protein SCO1/2
MQNPPVGAWTTCVFLLLFGVPSAGGDQIPGVSEFPRSKARVIKGGAFSLTDHLGRNVADSDFQGEFLLIYFGYTHCPDVCPAALSVMHRAIDLLGDDGIKVQPLFVTFDPVRDTVERVADYVTNFHPRLIGLTGSREQTLAAAEHYGVDVSATYKAEQPGSAYSMNHSAFTYLVGPTGRLKVMFRDGTDAPLMAGTIRRHLGAR